MAPSSGSHIAVSLLIAAGIGALIGIEREHRSQTGHPHSAGIRTFTLFAVFGALIAYLTEVFSPHAFIAGALAATALVIAVAFNDFRRGDLGITTEISLLITFALGVLVHSGEPIVATGIALGVTLILSLKVQLRSFAGQLSEDDLFAIIKFVTASALLLPLLPSSPLDAAGIFIPQQIGLTVVLVLALNFISYFLAKFWNAQKGILTTAFFGGLISSTATTWNFAGRSRDDGERELEYAQGTLVALLVTLPRVGILAFITSQSFGLALFPWLATMAAAILIPLWMLSSRCPANTGNSSQIALGNPFELQEGLRFGLFFIFIVYLIHHARILLGEAGLYVTAALAAFADLDAITLSISQLVRGELPMIKGIGAILLAINVNNLIKLGIAFLRGGRRYRLWVASGAGAMLITGAILQLIL